MLTARGFWFFVALLVLLGVAVAAAATSLILVALTLLAWFLAQWLLFQWQVARARHGLDLRRTLRTARGEARSLWAGQKAEVRVTLASKVGLPYAVMVERIPELARLKDSLTPVAGPLTPQTALELAYDIVCPAPGRLRFEGVRLELSDLQGFFSSIHFVHDPREYRVLPPLAVEPEHPTFVKQHNALPLLGKHRHPRPGTGSELLDLRDYLPGDPPKLIAWKASARRDRLMTKEFESEVPIRCTLLLDASSSVRLGPVGATALTRLVVIAAAVAQAATAERDLIGLCLCDEAGVRRLLRPARGPRHWLSLLDVLTDAACLMPEVPGADLHLLLAHAYRLAQEAYPELLDADVNAMPWWLPLWSPQPYWTLRLPPLPTGSWWRAVWRRLRRSPLAVHNRRGSRFSPAHHRRYRRRKQLAAILSVRHGLAPGGLALLLEDDDLCALHLQRFLAEHQVAVPHSLYDDQGRYRFAASEKVAVLSRALLGAIRRGKDNELFVLCADLLEAGPDLAILERAVCVARARHHQVVVICPWPADFAPPSPSGRGVGDEGLPTPPPLPDTTDLDTLLHAATTVRLHQAFARLRYSFGRLGVQVLCAAEHDAVGLILARLQQLRGRAQGVR
jgi:uncharacterized protein (DUF58 family)